MSGLERSLESVLGRYMAPILAQSVRRRAQSALGVREGLLAVSDLPRLRAELEAGVRLFVAPERQAEALTSVLALGPGGAPAADRERIDITTEADVARARQRARAAAERLGGDAFMAQRAATAASELSRNILLYAKSGWLELGSGVGRSLLLVAIDQGPGIADLEQVLAGRYRSRTGLGRGLLGVRRLSNRFDVRTGPTGTRVEAEIPL